MKGYDFIMKKISAVLAAAAIAASMSASVFATDYSSDPQYPLPSYGGSSENHSRPMPGGEKNNPNVKIERPAAEGTDLSNPTKLITKDDVLDAIESDSPIYASYESATVKSNAMAALARTKFGKLTVITKRYTATIDSESVTEAKDIDLGMSITKVSKRGAMIVRTNQAGSFGCTVNVTVSSKYYSQCGVDLNSAHTYYIDTATKDVVDMGAVKLDSEGNILISMVNGGKYIVM